MTTHPSADEIPEVLHLVAKEAETYLAAIDDLPVRDPGAEDVAASFGGQLPERGDGALVALRELLDGLDGAVRAAGPKFFHFVNGGVTPAALGADWLASAIDQNPGAWVASPLAGRLESVALGWLRDLFGLPSDGGGVLTTGATMANFVALACARRWWGLRHGVDVDQRGFTGLPPMPVLAGG